jgi:hypothetical protein
VFRTTKRDNKSMLETASLRATHAKEIISLPQQCVLRFTHDGICYCLCLSSVILCVCLWVQVLCAWCQRRCSSRLLIRCIAVSISLRSSGAKLHQEQKQRYLYGSLTDWHDLSDSAKFESSQRKTHNLSLIPLGFSPCHNTHQLTIDTVYNRYRYITVRKVR